jgi:hypothetical protein
MQWLADIAWRYSVCSLMTCSSFLYETAFSVRQLAIWRSPYSATLHYRK